MEQVQLNVKLIAFRKQVEQKKQVDTLQLSTTQTLLRHEQLIYNQSREWCVNWLQQEGVYYGAAGLLGIPACRSLMVLPAVLAAGVGYSLWHTT